MDTKKILKNLRRERAKLEQQLDRVVRTISALDILHGKAGKSGLGGAKKYTQSAKARKAIGAAKKKWWAEQKAKQGKKS
jgi:hypothetical protein